MAKEKNPDTLALDDVYDAQTDTDGRALIAVEKDGKLITVNPDTLAAHKQAGWKEV
jgi:hypothetical protein